LAEPGILIQSRYSIKVSFGTIEIALHICGFVSISHEWETPGSNPLSPTFHIVTGFWQFAGYADSGPGGWLSTFASNFASNWASITFYKSELGEGGCLNVFAEGFEQADILAPALNASPGFAETAIKGQAATVAARYAAGRALTVPLRSSVVRGILETGEAGGTYFAPVYLEAQGAFGLYKEGAAAFRGECH